MSNKIHSSAIIEKGVVIGENNIISENVIIRKNVRIGNNNYIGPNSIIENIVNIGNRNKFYGFLSLGSSGEMGSKGDIIPDKCEVRIGDNNVFREFITINFPVRKKMTSISNKCYFMARTHIPHDAMIGNNVVMATNSLIGGGCILNDYVYVGLNAHVHQWLTIGEGSILGMNSATVKSVPPFLTVIGVPSKAIKINQEGLKRRNYSKQKITDLRKYLSNNLEHERTNVLINKYKQFIDLHDNCLEL